MEQKKLENTMFIGNGFSRTIFQNMPSWGELFEGGDSSIENYTILYEISRLNSGKQGKNEETIKSELIRRIEATFSKNNINKDINELEEFGENLCKHNVNNIITTNYDGGIELILCHICGYEIDTPKEMVSEKIYSIRTYKILTNKKTGHSVKLWKIHGELERIPSITLGFDQYCGSLAKVMAYVKGTYNSSQKNKDVKCTMNMKEKCMSQKFDNLSWVELFFKTNIYIVGFGMDFSEIDIWWLLNKRARFMLEITGIRNTITYLNNPDYENEKVKTAIFATLKAFQVTTSSIVADDNYISNIFEKIK